MQKAHLPIHRVDVFHKVSPQELVEIRHGHKHFLQGVSIFGIGIEQLNQNLKHLLEMCAEIQTHVSSHLNHQAGTDNNNAQYTRTTTDTATSATLAVTLLGTTTATTFITMIEYIHSEQ